MHIIIIIMYLPHLSSYRHSLVTIELHTCTLCIFVLMAGNSFNSRCIIVNVS